MNPELEAKLSALLDGELAPEEAAALREEIVRQPELAARLAELAAVDDALRALPGRRVPGDLRARLEQGIEAETMALPPAASARRAPPRRAPRSGAASGWRRRWLAAVALAAAAAALALLALPRMQREETQIVKVEPAPTPEEETLAAEELAEAADLPVIEVLDVLAELDELEGAGSG
jgi:anti-sigma factor RsiW